MDDDTEAFTEFVRARAMSQTSARVAFPSPPLPTASSAGTSAGPSTAAGAGYNFPPSSASSSPSAIALSTLAPYNPSSAVPPPSFAQSPYYAPLAQSRPHTASRHELSLDIELLGPNYSGSPLDAPPSNSPAGDGVRQRTAVAQSGAGEEPAPLAPLGKQQQKKLNKKLKKKIKKSIKSYRSMNKPKMFLANERTYLRWIGQTLALGSMGTTVITFMSGSMRYPGFIMWGLALGFLIYATVKFRRRAHALANQRPSPDYDAPIGPAVFMLSVMGAVLTYVIALIVDRH